MCLTAPRKVIREDGSSWGRNITGGGVSGRNLTHYDFDSTLFGPF